MWLSRFCPVFLILFLLETSSTNILYRRTKRLRRFKTNLGTEGEIVVESMGPRDVRFPSQTYRYKRQLLHADGV